MGYPFIASRRIVYLYAVGKNKNTTMLKIKPVVNQAHDSWMSWRCMVVHLSISQNIMDEHWASRLIDFVQTRSHPSHYEMPVPKDWPEPTDVTQDIPCNPRAPHLWPLSTHAHCLLCRSKVAPPCLLTAPAPHCAVVQSPKREGVWGLTT